MKRALTLTGAILGLVGGAFLSIIYLITLIGTIELMSYGYGAGPLVLAIILVAVSVLGLVFSAVCIAPWNKPAEGYKKKKGTIITAVVFNFISALATLIMLIAGFSGWVVILMILGMLLAIASAVLLLVDVCAESGRIEKAAQKVAGQSVAAQPAVASAANDAKLASAEIFEKKLAKLNAMKEHGIITEEEYTEIKKSYVKEFLG